MFLFSVTCVSQACDKKQPKACWLGRGCRPLPNYKQRKLLPMTNPSDKVKCFLACLADRDGSTGPCVGSHSTITVPTSRH